MFPQEEIIKVPAQIANRNMHVRKFSVAFDYMTKNLLTKSERIETRFLS